MSDSTHIPVNLTRIKNDLPVDISVSLHNGSDDLSALPKTMKESWLSANFPLTLAQDINYAVVLDDFLVCFKYDEASGKGNIVLEAAPEGGILPVLTENQLIFDGKVEAAVSRDNQMVYFRSFVESANRYNWYGIDFKDLKPTLKKMYESEEPLPFAAAKTSLEAPPHLLIPVQAIPENDGPGNTKLRALHWDGKESMIDLKGFHGTLTSFTAVGDLAFLINEAGDIFVVHPGTLSNQQAAFNSFLDHKNSWDCKILAKQAAWQNLVAIDMIRIYIDEGLATLPVAYLYGLKGDGTVEIMQYFGKQNPFPTFSSFKYSVSPISDGLSIGNWGGLFMLSEQETGSTEANTVVVNLDPGPAITYFIPAKNEIPLASWTFVLKEMQDPPLSYLGVTCIGKVDEDRLTLTYREAGPGGEREFFTQTNDLAFESVAVGDLQKEPQIGLIVTIGEKASVGGPIVVVTELDIDPEKIM